MYDYSHVLFEKFQDKAKIVKTLLKCAPEAKGEEENTDSALNENTKKMQSISTLTQKIKDEGVNEEGSEISENSGQKRNSSVKENLDTIKETRRSSSASKSMSRKNSFAMGGGSGGRKSLSIQERRLSRMKSLEEDSTPGRRKSSVQRKEQMETVQEKKKLEDKNRTQKPDMLSATSNRKMKPLFGDLGQRHKSALKR